MSGRKGAPEYGIIDHIVVRNVFGGLSKIGFKSCDQGREKFQGASLDYVWFDEEPPYDVYEECVMRVLDRCGEIHQVCPYYPCASSTCLQVQKSCSCDNQYPCLPHNAPPQHQKLFIFKNCTNLIRELKSYWWSKGDNPKKVDDHALDALRYYIMTKPSLNEAKFKELSEIEKDKSKLMRKLKRL